MTAAELAAHSLQVALADQREAAALVARYERARMTHTPAYQGALAVLESCSARVARRLASVNAACQEMPHAA